MRTVAAQVHIWSSGAPLPCTYHQCITMFTEDLAWLIGRDLERATGQGVCDRIGWKRGATP